MAEESTSFATVQDISTLWRPLTNAEQVRATALLPIVSDALRIEAEKVGKNLDSMIAESTALASVAKSVTVDIVSRMLLASTENEPATQFSSSALGYSISGTLLNPGGGLYIKKAELVRLGLKKQRLGVIDLA